MTTNKYNVHYVNLPIKGKLALTYVSSFLIATLMTVASIAGLLCRVVIYPTNELIQTFVPNDVVNLFIGLPILLGSMWLAWRGKLIGLLCWTGALFFVSYNYIIYIFAMPQNWTFLLHLMLAMLSVYTLISLLANIDGDFIQQRLSGAVPEKLSGGVLAGLGLVFFLRAIGILIVSFTKGTLLPGPELAVTISDFLTTPAWVIGGILLWQRRKLGYVTGLGLLFQGSMLFTALIIFLLLQPLLTSTSLAIVDIAVIFAMGLICFIPFALFARGVVAKQKTLSD